MFVNNRRNNFYLGAIAGVPIYLDYSLVFLLLMFLFDFSNYQEGFAGLLLGFMCACMLMISIVAHEFGHILAARVFGYNAQSVTLSLLGGCASFIRLPQKAWQEFVTAIAGPIVSFAMCGLFYGIFHAILRSVQTGGAVESSVELMAMTMLFSYKMNFILGAFNLLPGFPMDGGRVFRSFMRFFVDRPRATYFAMILGRVCAVLIAVNGFKAIFGGTGWGFIQVLIAWMIWREGAREYNLAVIEDADENKGSVWRAKVSPPPYGGGDSSVDVRKK